MNNRKAIRFAIYAALLYAISAPFSKMLLKEFSPTFLAGLLYLGAGLGMIPVRHLSRKSRSDEKRFTHKDYPYLALMIILDIAAPILLMFALKNSSAESVSLLNNFEIVATSVIALFIFKEKISGRLWTAIGFITVASLLLSLSDITKLTFSLNSAFAILACLCWGLENNCTRRLSSYDPSKIVIIKGLGSGTGSLLIALFTEESIGLSVWIIPALLLGFVAYGLSIYTYVYAQRFIAAAKTSAFYALSPFIVALLSLMISPKIPSVLFISAFILMAIGAGLAIEKERKTNE